MIEKERKICRNIQKVIGRGGRGGLEEGKGYIAVCVLVSSIDRRVQEGNCIRLWCLGWLPCARQGAEGHTSRDINVLIVAEISGKLLFCTSIHTRTSSFAVGQVLAHFFIVSFVEKHTVCSIKLSVSSPPTYLLFGNAVMCLFC